MFLSPTPEVHRPSIQMTCPPPPRPARRDLSTHLQIHHVTSIFTPMPFNRQGGTSTTAVANDLRVLKPRPMFGTDRSVFASLPRPVSRFQRGPQQREGSSIDDADTESGDPMMSDDVSLKPYSTTTTNIKKPRRRRSSCNSAA